MSLPKLTIEYVNGETEVVGVRASDRVRFEQQFQIPYVSAFIEFSMSAERGDERPDQYLDFQHVAFLAFSAATNCKDVEFLDWLDNVAGVSFGAPEPEAETVPLDPTPTPADSLSLPSNQGDGSET